jgi:hypothetical protein
MVSESASVSVITFPVARVTEPLREDVPEMSMFVKKEVFGTLVPVPNAGGLVQSVPSNWSAFRLATLVVEATTNGAAGSNRRGVLALQRWCWRVRLRPVAVRVVKTPAAGVFTLSSVQITESESFRTSLY